MNKQWLIKINGEEDLYFDSEIKEYRLRLFCPNCHKPSGCKCYQRYEDYTFDSMSDFPTMCCSYLCCLVANSDIESESITEAAKDLRLDTKEFSEYTEKEAEQIINRLVEESIWDFTDESIGELCGK